MHPVMCHRVSVSINYFFKIKSYIPNPPQIKRFPDYYAIYRTPLTVVKRKLTLTTISMSQMEPMFFVRSGPAFNTHYRNYQTKKSGFHSDLEMPDFTPYRKGATKDPHSKNKDSIDDRIGVTATLALVSWAGLWYGTKAHTLHYILFFGPSKEVLALAKIEVKISDIPEGKSGLAKWRGKPLFIRHRTQDEIDKERAVNWKSLRDPERDEDRVQKAEWLIVIGICTHLGCIPVAYLGDYNGYYCPCHGSHFDASGRIRMGPAPTNLPVPEYTFIDDDTIVVG